MEDGMQISSADEADKRRVYPRKAVFTVSSLPPQQKGSLDRSVLARVPVGYRRAVLDAHVFRSRSLNAWAGRREEFGIKIAGRLATEGAAEFGWFYDPLFWCLGIWGAIWSPPSTPAPLEPHQFSLDFDAVSGRPSPSPAAYRTMAAWACRQYAPQPQSVPLCLEICNEIRDGGSRFGTFAFPSRETTAWIRWAGTARGVFIPWPDSRLGTWEHHRNRWKDLGFGPAHASALLEAMSQVRDEAFARYLAEEITAARFERGTALCPVVGRVKPSGAHARIALSDDERKKGPERVVGLAEVHDATGEILWFKRYRVKHGV